jgi:hypothetical protein
MARPKTRQEGIPRFEIGERVVWKSGTHWKMGTIICLGKTKKEAESNLPNGYKIQYNSKKEIPLNTQFIYFVASDTPLFKPGFIAHSVPERHLQKHKESWYSKQEIMWEEYKSQDFFELALGVAKAIHKNPKDVPKEIRDIFVKTCPNLN